MKNNNIMYIFSFIIGMIVSKIAIFINIKAFSFEWWRFCLIYDTIIIVSLFFIIELIKKYKYKK